MIQEIDYQAVTAWVGLLAAVAAVVALIFESRRWRFSLGIDTLMKLRTQFHSEDMHKARSAAAKSIGAKTYSDTAEVLNFFETVGLLTRLGALDEHMVWHAFFYWIDGYCQAAKDDIEECRRDDPTSWADLMFIHRQVTRIEDRERRRAGAPAKRTPNLERFLDDEARPHG
ncbi:MAG: hypothetical protein JF614_27595 [Acidobacteria bacterium]|nr:hypothetical protein [Acidobacteriota bacterium]